MESGGDKVEGKGMAAAAAVSIVTVKQTPVQQQPQFRRLKRAFLDPKVTSESKDAAANANDETTKMIKALVRVKEAAPGEKTAPAKSFNLPERQVRRFKRTYEGVRTRTYANVREQVLRNLHYPMLCHTRC